MFSKISILTILLVLCFSSYAKTKVDVTKVANLPKWLYESSGLIFYKNKLITHNDGGHRAELYVLNDKGEHEHTVSIQDVKNYDWEDLAQDGKRELIYW